jgi:hypothetical protein
MILKYKKTKDRKTREEEKRPTIIHQNITFD